MDLPKIIAELQAEKLRLDSAILALEEISTSTVRSRGRPPQSRRRLPSEPVKTPSELSAESASEPQS